MGESKKVLDKEVEVEVSKLRVAQWYSDLRVFERDCTFLRASFAKHGFKREYPIVVRLVNRRVKDYEIICGHQRVKIAEEFYLERVPAVVKDIGETEARRYAAEDNLSPTRICAPITLIHAILLARELERQGVNYTVKDILNLTGTGLQTYKRAVTSFEYALGVLRSRFSELAGLSESALTAECIRRNLWPDFKEFCNNNMAVYTFYRVHYLPSSLARERSSKQRGYRRLPPRQDSHEQANLISSKLMASIPVQDGMATLCGILESAWRTPEELFSSISRRQPNQELLDLLEPYKGRKGKIIQILKGIIRYFDQPSRKGSAPTTLPLFPSGKDNGRGL